MMGQRPQRGPVTVDDDGLAREHPPQHRPAAVERNQGLVIGVRGPHDRGRESLLTVGVDAQVRRGGADEDVLPGPPAEQADVGLDLPGSERHPVDDRVEVKIFNLFPNGPWFPYVGPQHRDAGRERPGGALSPVQDGQLDTAFHRDPRARRADDPAAADEQDPELSHPPTLVPGPGRRAAEMPLIKRAEDWGAWARRSGARCRPASESKPAAPSPDRTRRWLLAHL